MDPYLSTVTPAEALLAAIYPQVVTETKDLGREDPRWQMKTAREQIQAAKGSYEGLREKYKGEYAICPMLIDLNVSTEKYPIMSVLYYTHQLLK